MKLCIWENRGECSRRREGEAGQAELGWWPLGTTIGREGGPKAARNTGAQQQQGLIGEERMNGRGGASPWRGEGREKGSDGRGRVEH